MLTVAGLLILGGLGFLVLFNLSSIEFWRRDLLRRGRLSLHSYIALVTSGILLAAGWVLFLLLEHEHTLAGLGWADKFSCAFFQAATPRTAGFNVVDVALLKPATRFVTLLLMFIGGSPGSTAGGIKTTTLVVLVITVAAMIRGRADTEIRMRTIPGQVVREAISIFMLGALCVVAVFAWLLLTEQRGLLAGGAAAPGDLLFETVSAFGTVGLSTGVTPALSDLGKLGIIVCMFVGRLGPLTLALIVGGRDLRQPLRFPEEEVVVG